MNFTTIPEPGGFSACDKRDCDPFHLPPVLNKQPQLKVKPKERVNP